MARRKVRAPVGGTLVKSSNGKKVKYEDQIWINLETISVEDLAIQLQKVLKDHGDEYEDMDFGEDEECGCYGGCSCPPTYFIQGRRRENDIEYSIRVENETEDNDRQVTKDLNEYNRLRIKLGREE